MLLELYGLCTLDRYDFTGNTDLPNAGDFELFCENDLGICNENINQDSVLLTAFFFRTNGTSWTNTWDLELPMSTWNGVTLNADGRVVEINLRDNNLTGTIPSHIYQLENLKVLDLGENRINGWQTTSFFPDNIEVLRLDNNNLHSNLSFLPKITNDAQLRVLDLSDNHFYGCFSDRLSTLCQNNISYNFANNDLITSLEAYCTHSASACFETHHDCPKFTTVVTDATENTADGAIRLVQLNETTPVEYSWNTGANTQNLLNIPVGNYQVTLTSESDCSVDAKYNKLYRYSKTKVLPLEDAVVSVDSMLIENEEEVILSELSQIQSICLNIEHSYMRDLEISLTCPNGQSMILHEYSGRLN
ncbi:MAG: proprotein convertase P-domain-containing protein [Bacteroidota bacterium]